MTPERLEAAGKMLRSGIWDELLGDEVAVACVSRLATLYGREKPKDSALAVMIGFEVADVRNALAALSANDIVYWHRPFAGSLSFGGWMLDLDSGALFSACRRLRDSELQAEVGPRTRLSGLADGPG